MDPAFWQSLGTAAVLTPVAAVSAWKAWRAEEQTRSTGNGWSSEVTEQLRCIAAQAQRTEGKVDRTNDLVLEHLAAHAENDIRRRNEG